MVNEAFSSCNRKQFIELASHSQTIISIKTID